MTSTLEHLPRFVSLHQLARRAGINRSTLTLMLARGSLHPTAMQSLGDGREAFLFPIRTIEKLTTKTEGDNALL